MNANILVNNKGRNLSVSITEEISFNWSSLMIEQVAFSYQILSDNQLVAHGYETNTTPYCSVKIEHHTKRKKYEFILKVEKNNGQKVISKTHFYSSNDSLNESHWITRLDNPLEKETAYYDDLPNIVLEKKVVLAKCEGEYFLDICGLGYYNVRINNQRVNDFYLNSDVTNYSKKVYYDTFEISKWLFIGENTITVELGNGWYNPAPLKLLGKYNSRLQLAVGKPKLICQLTELVENEQQKIIESDTSWESQCGEYLFNNLYVGERVLTNNTKKLRLNRQMKMQTVTVPGPGGSLLPSTIEKVRRTAKHEPINIIKKPDSLVIDFGRIISGHLSFRLVDAKGKKIKVFYAEGTDSQGKLDFTSSICGTYSSGAEVMGYKEGDDVVQFDEIICETDDYVFENNFTYHSFRYVEIQNVNPNSTQIKNLIAYSVHTDLSPSFSFESSNLSLNKLVDIANQTKLNNLHSIYEDCARERLGYGGDIVALIESQITSFSSEAILEKVLSDFFASQINDGGITQTAPFVGIQTHGTSNKAGSLGWQLVVPTIIEKLIKYYDTPNILKKYQRNVEYHIEYLLAFDYDYIKYCCLGDWGGVDTIIIDGRETPPDREFCGATMYYMLLEKYHSLYLDLLTEELSNKLEVAIQQTRTKIINEFYNQDGFFQSGSQSTYVFALKSGLSDNKGKLYQNFLNQIKEDDGVLKLGIFGMAWAYEVLSSEDDTIIYEWLTRREFPSFQTMVDSGNQVLSEYFDASWGSYNHAMFSSYPIWLREKLLGIKIDSHSKGCDRVIISPFFPDDLNHVSGTFDTIRGEIRAFWKRVDGTIEYRIEIPNAISYEIVSDYLHTADKTRTNKYTKLKIII